MTPLLRKGGVFYCGNLLLFGEGFSKFGDVRVCQERVPDTARDELSG
jgi:hypothetical protein